MLQPIERRIERALLDDDGAAGDLLEAQQHAISVDLAERNRLQDDDVEVAWQEVSLLRHGLS